MQRTGVLYDEEALAENRKEKSRSNIELKLIIIQIFASHCLIANALVEVLTAWKPTVR